MNKEDSIKEKFKQALQSTYKVISDDYKVVKNKNLSPRLKKLKKGILIKSPFKKKTVAKSA